MFSRVFSIGSVWIPFYFNKQHLIMTSYFEISLKSKKCRYKISFINVLSTERQKCLRNEELQQKYSSLGNGNKLTLLGPPNKFPLFSLRGWHEGTNRVGSYALGLQVVLGQCKTQQEMGRRGQCVQGNCLFGSLITLEQKSLLLVRCPT